MRKAMKFAVEKLTKEGVRSGTVTGCKSDPERVTRTPMCMVHTIVGSAPNLARDMLDRIECLPATVHYTLSSLTEHHDAIGDYGKGIANFAAMRGFLSYCSIQDPAVAVTPGYNDKASVSVWGRAGRIKIDMDMFVKVQEALKVDCYQALSDGDTDKESSRKRIRKSVDRTLDFLDKCIERHQTSKELQDSGIFGVIEGGFDEQERLRSAKETAKRPVSGFCIEGFHNMGPAAEAFHITEVSSLLKSVMEVLPKDKPRLMHGTWRPDKVMEALALGIDIFDSSYPYIVTERNSALVFDFELPKHDPEADNGDGQKKETEKLNENSQPFEMNMKNTEHFESFLPLYEGCSCYTCKTHSRSYIHHLINTSELLAGILLMIHNFHHYFSFFETIRTAIATDRLPELEEKIKSQLQE